MWKLVACAAWALLLSSNAVVNAFEYNITGAGVIILTDNATEIPDIKTLFLGQPVKVGLVGLEWEHLENYNSTESRSPLLRWTTSVNGQVQDSGTVDLSLIESRDLPETLDAGLVMVDASGRYTITVEVVVEANESTASSSGDYQAYAAGVSLVPIFVVLLLAMTTHMVELSLFATVFLGSCMVAGELNMGFKTTLDVYILNALADINHGYIYLFSMFLSGLVAMMEKSGGMSGLVKFIARFVTSSRSAQAATFAVGVLVFFDDYANCLLAGQTMRPLTDLLMVSREKLAFIVDATAAPIASLVPASSWVGFEVGLIQDQINTLIDLYGEENLTIKTSGLAVFLETIKYRYYPIFMLILIPVLIATKRDFMGMLLAERKVQVFQRTDGGDGKGPAGQLEEAAGGNPNGPRSDTPELAFNMGIPVLLLVFLIFFLLIKSGEDPTVEQGFMDMMENADSYSALLYSTMATNLLVMLFYSFQIVQHGRLVVPTPAVMKALWIDPWFNKGKRKGGDGEDHEGEEVNMDKVEQGETAALTEPDIVPDGPRSLMSIHECIESFLYGLSRIFPALIVLTLAWASGSIMIAVGADRLFSSVITGGIPPQALPTLSFVISVFMALATGTSWGTMTILFPLVTVPTYKASNGDPTIFYAVVAGILSGSVAGDHMSPISDTTVLSALASDCQLINHVSTQFPYAIFAIILSILFGTVPIGSGAWPNIVGILLGTVAIGLFAFAFCVPILSPTGRYDPITWLALKCKKADDPLYQLQRDTIAFVEQSTAASAEDDSAPSGNTTADNGAADHDETKALSMPEFSHEPADETEVVA